MRGEEEPVRLETVKSFGQQSPDRPDEGGVIVETGHEVELARPGVAERVLVLSQAHPRVVGCEGQPDQLPDALCGRLLRGLRDEGRRVLHADEGWQSQLGG